MKESYRSAEAGKSSRRWREVLLGGVMMLGVTSDCRSPGTIERHTATEALDASSMSIMTANVRGFEQFAGNGSNKSSVLDAIDSAQPDVICFQEFNVDQEQAFVQDLVERGYSVVFSATVRQGFHGQREGNAVASKGKILKFEAQPLPYNSSGTPRQFQSVVIDTNMGDITIANTHLGLDADERYRQAKYMQQISGGQDINCGDYNENFFVSFGAGKSVSLGLFIQDIRNSTAYNANFSTHHSGSHIDIISTNCGKIATKPQALEIGSDHSAITARFNLSNCN